MLLLSTRWHMDACDAQPLRCLYRRIVFTVGQAEEQAALYSPYVVRKMSNLTRLADLLGGDCTLGCIVIWAMVRSTRDV